ncbi:MAG: hypothetical protein ACP5TY_04955 [Thermodesulforhabdaceae bacterium]
MIKGVLHVEPGRVQVCFSIIALSLCSLQGNINTRIEFEKDKLALRINTGDRSWIKANIKRTVARQKDEWINFSSDLTQAEKTKKHFSYTVELRAINGEFYSFTSHEEKNMKAGNNERKGSSRDRRKRKSIHIAMAFVKPDGNLSSVGRIPMHHLINGTKNQREYLIWKTVHRVVNTARRGNKAIAMERLKDLPEGER